MISDGRIKEIAEECYKAGKEKSQQETFTAADLRKHIEEYIRKAVYEDREGEARDDMSGVFGQADA